MQSIFLYSAFFNISKYEESKIVFCLFLIYLKYLESKILEWLNEKKTLRGDFLRNYSLMKFSILSRMIVISAL